MKKFLLFLMVVASFGVLARESTSPDQGVVKVSIVFRSGEHVGLASRSLALARQEDSSSTLRLKAMPEESGTADVREDASGSISFQANTEPPVETVILRLTAQTPQPDDTNVVLTGHLRFSKLQSIDRYPTSNGQSLALPTTENGSIPVQFKVGKVGEVDAQRLVFTLRSSGERIPVTVSAERLR